MPRTSIFVIPFPRAFNALVKKGVNKGRTKAEVDEAARWLKRDLCCQEKD